jgi:hypothetical protein
MPEQNLGLINRASGIAPCLVQNPKISSNSSTACFFFFFFTAGPIGVVVAAEVVLELVAAMELVAAIIGSAALRLPDCVMDPDVEAEIAPDSCSGGDALVTREDAVGGMPVAMGRGVDEIVFGPGAAAEVDADAADGGAGLDTAVFLLGRCCTAVRGVSTVGATLDDVLNDDGALEASGRSTGSGDWASGESRSNVDAKREDAKDAESDNEDKDVSDEVASCEVTPVATRSSSSDSSSS